MIIEARKEAVALQPRVLPATGVATASPVAGAASRRRRPFLMVACWSYLLAVVAVCAFMRLQGDRAWLGTFLLMAPRWPFALPIAVLLPTVFIARRWLLAAVVSVALAVVVCPLMGFRLSVPASEPQRGDLRLLTFNVHRKQVDVSRLRAQMAELAPDVVALQDWSSSLEKPLFGEGGWHTRQVGELFVASRYPIRSAAPVNFSEAKNAPKAERGAAAAFELLTPRGSVYLINLHLASPHTALNALVDDGGAELSRNVLRRWAQSDAVRSLVDGIAAPVLVAGDFNTTNDSPIFREHWQGFADAFIERGLGFGYTYLNDHTQLRIDHILMDTSWSAKRAWVGGEAGSPHRPLIADLQLR